MKRFCLILMTFSLLLIAGCTGGNVDTGGTVPPAQSTPAPGSGEGEAEPADTPTLVTEAVYEDDAVRFSVQLPESWAYSILKGENPEGDQGGISFFPEDSDRSVHLSLYNYPFGVCGTGLEEKEFTLLDGSAGRVGYYDGSADWSFAVFPDASENLAATNEGLTGDDAGMALEILKTFRFSPED